MGNLTDPRLQEMPLASWVRAIVGATGVIGLGALALLFGELVSAGFADEGTARLFNCTNAERTGDD